MNLFLPYMLVLVLHTHEIVTFSGYDFDRCTIVQEKVRRDHFVMRDGTPIGVDAAVCVREYINQL
jgi:hypothetical protein